MINMVMHETNDVLFSSLFPSLFVALRLVFWVSIMFVPTPTGLYHSFLTSSGPHLFVYFVIFFFICWFQIWGKRTECFLFLNFMILITKTFSDIDRISIITTKKRTVNFEILFLETWLWLTYMESIKSY